MAKCILVTALLLKVVVSQDNPQNITSSTDITPETTKDPSKQVDKPQYEQYEEYLWSYNTETAWPGKMCQGEGTRQSPINIVTSNVIRDVSSKFIKYGPLRFRGYDNVLVSGINNGHTLQFSTEGDPSMQPILTGGPLKHLYRLEQLHFHWLSEHAVDGQKYPMELHFVHIRSDLDVDRALNEQDGLATVAVFCNVLSEQSDKKYAVDEDLMQHIPSLGEKGTRLSGVVVNLQKLLRHSEDYFTYAGSLTTPECNEAVIWIIFENPIYITDEQYRYFSNTGIGHNNVRSIQPVAKHTVYGSAEPAPELMTPAVVKAMQHFVQVMKEFFGNVGKFFSHGFKDKNQ